jgi:hypothetical protein
VKKYTHDELKALDPVTYAKEWNEEHRTEGFTLPEDPHYFESNGWRTAYDYEKDMAASTLSDVYKETYGFRPRGIYPIETMTLADIEEEISILVRAEEERAEAKRRRDAEAAAKVAEATNPVPLTHNPFAALAGFGVK